MGRFYYMTCRNKECRYRIELREGPGMFLFAREKTLEEAILNGEREAPDEFKNLLKSGHRLDIVGNYLCPRCQEWKVENYPYILELIKASPYGTIRDYKVHFLNGNPKCEKCGGELEFIIRPRSGKNRCPKCGTDNMIASRFGYYD